jgi:hypothetical protein
MNPITARMHSVAAEKKNIRFGFGELL